MSELKNLQQYSLKFATNFLLESSFFPDYMQPYKPKKYTFLNIYYFSNKIFSVDYAI